MATMLNRCALLSTLAIFSLLSQRSSAFQIQSVIRSQRSTAFHSFEARREQDDGSSLAGLDVAVVGAGPSGLLLAHRLKASGAKVSVYESRPRPLEVSKELRAYALGVGMRGRTAIQSVDVSLWNKVKREGFPSERFHFHAGPLRIRLRDGGDGRSNKKSDDTTTQEPSILFYQTDLCRVMAEELENRWNGPDLKLSFDTKVADIDLGTAILQTENGDTHKFDLVVGCDGVNSVVRAAIEQEWPAFESSKQILPGELKVVRLPSMPPKLDPTAVALLLPKAGSCTAFVEPTCGGGCCILIAGRNASDPLLASSDTEELHETLLERFPLLEGSSLDQAASQLATTNISKAASVVCNTYHYSNLAVLVGDAAHATGGVSGQGVNSALMDSKVLADCILSNFDASQKEQSLKAALLDYSQKQVPEGKALYDLSFGPKPKSLWQRLRFSLSTVRDSIFRGRLGIGKLPLQTMLTTSLVPFAEIRKQRDRYYEEPFPSAEEWSKQLSELAQSNVSKEPAAAI